MAAGDGPALTVSSRGRADHVFAERLSRRQWKTLDVDAASGVPATFPPSAAKLEGGERKLVASCTSAASDAAAGVLRRGLVAAGASSSEAQAWSTALEAAARSRCPERADYRAEVRRLCAALKDGGSAEGGVVDRLRSGGAQASEVIVALPAEALLPAAKRQRLDELRAGPPQEAALQQYLYVDESMVCAECGKAGHVRYDRIGQAKEGFAKAEIWGSKENDSYGERCQAHCSACLAEWVFEM
eukprot:TRINITY_DN33369_c0_g1_i5.p1 TRINITY_DN33369_c0_g1~~TRINITY_DN33369_c0_g1_i5.p1  ORF type:complete len:243 (+),score=55.23 TRINITY_DN33369_c0_g1_i5:78-806(+)